MKINDGSLFLKQPHLFYQPLRFYGKNLTVPPIIQFYYSIIQLITV